MFDVVVDKIRSQIVTRKFRWDLTSMETNLKYANLNNASRQKYLLTALKHGRMAQSNIRAEVSDKEKLDAFQGVRRARRGLIESLPAATFDVLKRINGWRVQMGWENRPETAEKLVAVFEKAKLELQGSRVQVAQEYASGEHVAPGMLRNLMILFANGHPREGVESQINHRIGIIKEWMPEFMEYVKDLAHRNTDI